MNLTGQVYLIYLTLNLCIFDRISCFYRSKKSPIVLICRSHGWRIDTDEQDAHEMLNVLLTSLEEEAQKSTESVAASKTASLAFYDDIIGDDDCDEENEDEDDVESDEGDGARSRVSPSPPPVTTPGGESTSL